jgi:hypothetical protein
MPVDDVHREIAKRLMAHPVGQAFLAEVVARIKELNKNAHNRIKRKTAK